MIAWLLSKLAPVPRTPIRQLREDSLRNEPARFTVTQPGDPERHRLQSKVNLKTLRRRVLGAA